MLPSVADINTMLNQARSGLGSTDLAILDELILAGYAVDANGDPTAPLGTPVQSEASTEEIQTMLGNASFALDSSALETLQVLISEVAPIAGGTSAVSALGGSTATGGSSLGSMGLLIVAGLAFYFLIGKKR